MKKYPAIALIEFSNIANGIMVGNEMLKKAPIAMIKSGTVHNGKYLVLIGGSVASVEESYGMGLSIGTENIIDNMILPDVHQQLHDSILGQRSKCTADALGIIEAATVSTMIKASDAGIKSADVKLIEIRLADDIGGKSFTIFNGKIEEVQTAIETAINVVLDSKHWISDVVIPYLHTDMKVQINQSTSFAKVDLNMLSGGEV